MWEWRKVYVVDNFIIVVVGVVEVIDIIDVVDIIKVFKSGDGVIMGNR